MESSWRLGSCQGRNLFGGWGFFRGLLIGLGFVLISPDDPSFGLDLTLGLCMGMVVFSFHLC